MSMGFRSAIPELPVREVSAALDALEALGFVVAWRFGDDFASVYGGKRVEIHLRREALPTPTRLYLQVDDADAFHAAWAGHAEIVETLRDTPWGMREFTARIIDGHLIRVGHGLRSTRDIAAFTHPEPGP